MDMNQYPYNVSGYHAPDVTVSEFIAGIVLFLIIGGFAAAVVYYVATGMGAPVET